MNNMFNDDLSNEQIKNEDYTNLDIAYKNIDNCTFEKVDFSESRFDGTVFSNINFIDCNLSNCEFTSVGFHKCTFTNCKLLGTDIGKSVLKEITINNSVCRYINLYDNNFKKLTIDNSDFTEGRFYNCILNDTKFNEVQLIKAEFVKKIGIK